MALVTAGLAPPRVAEVVGKGDAEPLLPDRAQRSRATVACRWSCCTVSTLARAEQRVHRKWGGNRPVGAVIDGGSCNR